MIRRTRLASALRVALAAVLALTFAATSARAATLFGLVDTGELFASIDGGVAWTARSVLPVRDAVGLVAGDASAELFLVSRSGVIYRSADAGLGWTAAGAVAADDVTDFSLRSNGDLLVLTESGTLWRSADEGATFVPEAALSASNFVSLVIGNQGRLYALTATGEVYESVDGGTVWSAVGAIAVSDAENIRSIAPDLYVLAGSGDVYRSNDRGTSWTAIGTLSQVHMSGFVRDGSVLVAATREGEVARSPDGVAWTWQGAINQLSVIALGTDTPTVGVDGDGLPGRGVALAPPMPNPRMGAEAATFSFTLPRPDRVRFAIYDLRGRLVADRPPAGVTPAGRNSLIWDVTDLSAGVYVVRLTTTRERAETKWVVLP